MIKKLVTFSNIFTVFLIAFIVVMLVNPALKAGIIQGLMKIGLFQPDIPKVSSKVSDGTFSILGKAVTFMDDKGTEVNLSELKGKVLFINFWATWCPPCIAEMPSIQKLYGQFKNKPGVIFMMVDVDNDLEKSKAFMQKKGFDIPLYTVDSGLPNEVFSGTLPTTIIVDQSGKIVFRETGANDYSSKQFTAYLKKLTE